MNRLAARTTLSPSASLRVFLGCALLLFAGLTPAEAALNRITYSNGINPPIIVDDGDLADSDPDADEMRVEFSLVDANGDWTANGVILATTTHPNGATLVVTDTEILNVSGDQILGAQIQVNHYFDPIVSFTQQYTGHIDGEFDRIGGGMLGNLIITHAASLNGAVPIFNYNFPGGLVPAPLQFGDTGLPHHLDTVNRQTHVFIFYIDEIDNLIRFFDSATILPQGVWPVPGFAAAPLAVVAMLLLVLGGVVILRRRRAATSGVPFAS